MFLKYSDLSMLALETKSEIDKMFYNLGRSNYVQSLDDNEAW